MRSFLLGLGLFGWFSSPAPLLGQADRLPYESEYRSNLLYLHVLANYSFDIWSDFEWERRRVAGDGLRFSYGSVKTRDLLTDVDLRINREVGGGWWFLGHYRGYDSQHVQLRQRDFWAGLERSVLPGLSGFFRVNPSFDKELIDAEAGVTLFDSSREQYFRVAFQIKDFNYDHKNEIGGVSDQKPYALRWLFRIGRGPFWLTSEGDWGQGFERRFEDEEKSPDLAAFAQEENRGTLRLYYQPDPRHLLELSGQVYRFDEAKSARGGEEGSYAFRNRLRIVAARYGWSPGGRHGVRLALRRVSQESWATGWRQFAYDRVEWLPAVFYSHTRGKHGVEVGYMGSFYSWDYRGGVGVESYMADDLTEKVKLGYTYHFSDAASIQLSLSHVFSFWGFGGGNVQMHLTL